MKKGLTKYRGPEHLNGDVRLALTKLHALVSAEVSEHEQHSVIHVLGLDHRKPVTKGVAVYLVGAIASCIEWR